MLDINESKKCLIDICDTLDFHSDKKVMSEYDRILDSRKICNQSLLILHHGSDSEYFTKFNNGHYMLNKYQLIAAIIEVEKWRVWMKKDSSDYSFNISERSYYSDPDDSMCYIATIEADSQHITDPDMVMDRDNYIAINDDLTAGLLARSMNVKFEINLDHIKCMNSIDYTCLDFKLDYGQVLDQITDLKSFMAYLQSKAQEAAKELAEKNKN